jgi:hypothetical protein
MDASARPTQNGAALCTAHKRRDGSPCGAIAVKGTTKCKFHGGRSLSGPLHPSFKTGKYSKHLPAQLAARYEEARANPRLLSLGDDIAVAEARLAALLEQVTTGESASAWGDMQALMTEFEAARVRGDASAMGSLFQRLRGVVERGSAGVGAWDEIRKVWEIRGKLIQTETKTLLAMQQIMTVQQVMLMLGAATDAVVRAVQAHADVTSGRAILHDVMGEFTRLSTLEEK